MRDLCSRLSVLALFNVDLSILGASMSSRFIFNRSSGSLSLQLSVCSGKILIFSLLNLWVMPF